MTATEIIQEEEAQDMWLTAVEVDDQDEFWATFRTVTPRPCNENEEPF